MKREARVLQPQSRAPVGELTVAIGHSQIIHREPVPAMVPRHELVLRLETSVTTSPSGMQQVHHGA